MSMENGLTVLSAPRIRMISRFERELRGIANFNPGDFRAGECWVVNGGMPYVVACTSAQVRAGRIVQFPPQRCATVTALRAVSTLGRASALPVVPVRKGSRRSCTVLFAGFYPSMKVGAHLYGIFRVNGSLSCGRAALGRVICFGG